MLATYFFRAPHVITVFLFGLFGRSAAEVESKFQESGKAVTSVVLALVKKKSS